MFSMCRLTIISIAAQTRYTYILVITLSRKLFYSLSLSTCQLTVTTEVLAVKCTSMPLVPFGTASLDNLYIYCRISDTRQLLPSQMPPSFARRADSPAFLHLLAQLRIHCHPSVARARRVHAVARRIHPYCRPHLSRRCLSSPSPSMSIIHYKLSPSFEHC